MAALPGSHIFLATPIAGRQSLAARFQPAVGGKEFVSHAHDCIGRFFKIDVFGGRCLRHNTSVRKITDISKVATEIFKIALVITMVVAYGQFAAPLYSANVQSLKGNDTAK